jgi:hypothetical protein
MLSIYHYQRCSKTSSIFLQNGWNQKWKGCCIWDWWFPTGDPRNHGGHHWYQEKNVFNRKWLNIEKLWLWANQVNKLSDGFANFQQWRHIYCNSLKNNCYCNLNITFWTKSWRLIDLLTNQSAEEQDIVFDVIWNGPLKIIFKASILAEDIKH